MTENDRDLVRQLKIDKHRKGRINNVSKMIGPTQFDLIKNMIKLGTDTESEMSNEENEQ